jgi:hypothetical protein
MTDEETDYGTNQAEQVTVMAGSQTGFIEQETQDEHSCQGHDEAHECACGLMLVIYFIAYGLPFLGAYGVVRRDEYVVCGHAGTAGHVDIVTVDLDFSEIPIFEFLNDAFADSHSDNLPSTLLQRFFQGTADIALDFIIRLSRLCFVKLFCADE